MNTIPLAVVRLLTATLLAMPSLAGAAEVGVKLEPGFSLPATGPQTHLFQLGGAATFTGLYGLSPYIDVGPALSFVGLSSQDAAPAVDVESAWSLGPALRLKRPHDGAGGTGGFYGVSPWLDASPLYVRTGDLHRLGFSAAAGVSFPLDSARAVWLGPYFRYFQIFQSGSRRLDERDARTLIAGITFEVQLARAAPATSDRREAAAMRTDCPACEACPDGAPCPTGYADRDADLVPDTIDLCPDVAGAVEDGGCPHYDLVCITRDRLVLNEKILFAWDEATIEPSSYPLMDDVVRALQDNPSFKVKVQGHTDSSGPKEHNQDLSEQRAESVLAYLTSHGIAPGRLSSKGFASTVPTDSNETLTGRENNRRVEFIVEFVIVEDAVVR